MAGVALFLTVALTYPFVPQMAHVARIDNGDGQFAIWNVAWVARALVLDPLHVFDANIFYPHRGTLAYSESNLGAGIMALPVYWATKNPYLAHNTVVVLSFILSACGAYYLVRYVTGDRYAAAVSAICFAFCPYIFARTAEIQLMLTAGLPFSLLAFHRLADRPRMARAVVLGAAMAAEAICCGYYGVFITLVVGLAVLFVATWRSRWADGRYLAMVAAAAVVAVVLVAPAFAPYATLRSATGFTRPLDESVRWSANWQAYLASSAIGHVWMLPWIREFNEVLFPGFVATVFGLGGAVIGWRQGGRARETAMLYSILAILAIWASFGPAAGLYAVLYRVVPLFDWLHAPARFGILVTLALSVLAGLAISDLRRRVPYGSAVALALAVLAAGELARPLHFPSVPPDSSVYAVLKDLPPAPVIELPFYSKRSEITLHSQYMLNSTTHWMPLVNGYSDYTPPDWVQSAPVWSQFPSPESFRALERLHPRYAVFHLDLFNPVGRREVLTRLDQFAPFLRPLHMDGETRLYEIVAFR